MLPGFSPPTPSADLDATLEAELAAEGLTPVRDLLRRVAWGHRLPAQAGSLTPFTPDQIVRHVDLGLQRPTALALEAAVAQFESFGRDLSVAAWRRITLTLSAQDWLCVAGQWAALTREREWPRGRRLLEQAFSGGGAMRAQPQADEAMAAVLGAFRIVLASPQRQAATSILTGWLLAHGGVAEGPPLFPWAQGGAPLPHSAARVRWSDVSRAWLETHLAPVVAQDPLLSAPWLAAGPAELVEARAGLQASQRPDGPPHEGSGPWAPGIAALHPSHRWEALAARRDWSPDDLAQVAAVLPLAVVRDFAPQATPWGPLALRLLRDPRVALAPADRFALLHEALRDPETRMEARLDLPVVLAVLLDATSPQADHQAVTWLGDLLRAQGAWQTLPRDLQRRLLQHPAAAVRLLAVQHLGAAATHGPDADDGRPRRSR